MIAEEAKAILDVVSGTDGFGRLRDAVGFIAPR